MSNGSIIYPGLPPNLNPQSNGPWNLAIEFSCSVAGTNLLGVFFYKLAGDTGTHTATVYRTSDQAVMGQQAFAGESASGWQSLTLTTPIPLASGQAYRVAVSHNAASYEGATPFSGATAGPYTMSATGYAVAGSGTGYPTSAFPWWFGVDVLVDGMPGATALWASQVLAEAWVSDPTAVRASQVLAEAWLRQIPTTALVASQVLAEVWVPSPPPAPSWRRQPTSSQAP